jgi:heptosyltransferase-2/heptosyltransferase-3
MTNPASATERDRLAQRHLRARADAPARTLRQRVRLALLRQTSRRTPVVSLTRALPQRVLVIRPDHLGDLLFATPALHWLRQRLPDAHITALVGPWGEAVLAANSDIDQLLTCPFPGFTRQVKGAPWTPYRLLQTEAARLRSMQFDLALVLRFDHWWGAWLAAAAGIPRRVGYNIAEVAPFLTRAMPYLPGRHEVVQNLGLVMGMDEGGEEEKGREEGKEVKTGEEREEAVWRLRFEVTEEDVRIAGLLLAPAAAARPVVAIHPGSGAAVKRWRSEAWAELIAQLTLVHGAQVVFTGAASEAELIEPVLALLRQGEPLPSPPLSLAGQTHLGALAAVYKRCALVIGPDSGPLHLAVAVGAPTVHLYGPVDQRTFGPWGSPSHHSVVTSDWACIPCNRLDWPTAALPEHGCIRDINVEQVLSEASRLLQRAYQHL